ncbi:hypothetical protein P20495_2134 [Pseudoalteromonas sp. BSi20495]|nr:hypothetical protein P20495_2134 [Pseudoalteromonas sp. BSi20495]
MSDEIKGRQKKAATDTAVKKRSNSQQLVKKQLKKNQRNGRKTNSTGCCILYQS